MVLIPPDNVRQSFRGGVRGGGIVHQNDALGLFAGFPHDITVDGAGTGLSSDSILRADVPIDGCIPFFRSLLLQLGHDTFAAIASADGVGAPAGKPQIMDGVRVDVRADAFL